ncbi:hypothetical protein RB195_003434 [Necator americanus]|uniref:Animal hem peroxidase n=1 Tax=Necator americanus TaxID=51031 RepID=A0ABR1DQ31_NECAM
MRVLILLLLAAGCRADSLEDAVVEAIKTAHDNLSLREKDAATIEGDIIQTQKANADSQLEQLRGELLLEATKTAVGIEVGPWRTAEMGGSRIITRSQPLRSTAPLTQLSVLHVVLTQLDHSSQMELVTKKILKIVVGKFGSGVLDELANLDVDELLARAGEARKKRGATGCGLKLVDCTSEDSNVFRSITGKCNNPMNSTWGAAVTPVRRLLGKASYGDGFNTIRTKGVKGTTLPSTREVSNKLHQEGANPTFDYTRNHFYMQFGQWIAHDIIFMPSSVGPTGKDLNCTSCDSPQFSENCAPIPAPANDSYFKPFNNGTSRCIRLTRALNAQKGLGVRTQINQNTHFLDLSTVYGSEDCEGASVRSLINGELKTFIYNGDVLPPQKKNDSNCLSKDPFYCYTTGDFRNSLHPGLVPLHVTYIKEHNRIAAQFKKANPDWPDQRLFEEARRVNIAQFQHHVYDEYLPRVVGEKLMTDFRLKPLKSGFSTDYSPSVNAALSAEFAAAAFRFGHGQARKDFPRVTNKNTTAGSSVDLGNNIFYVDSHYAPNQGGIASFIEGMMQHAVMKADNEFSFPIRNQLFEIRGRPASGVDLVAVNIMRGRDIGLFPYNEYRTLVGLKKANTFDDLRSEMDATNVEALKKVYADVNDIDLYTGIMLERPMVDTVIGPTGGYIIAEQFAALKRGDRFFYENQVRGTRGLKPEELDAVRRSHLSKVICMNTVGMDNVPVDIFSLQSERVPCSTLPEVDIRFFIGQPPPPPPPPPPGKNKEFIVISVFHIPAEVLESLKTMDRVSGIYSGAANGPSTICCDFQFGFIPFHGLLEQDEVAYDMVTLSKKRTVVRNMRLLLQFKKGNTRINRAC